MKTRLKKVICAALTVSMLLAPAQPAWAGSAENPTDTAAQSETDWESGMDGYRTALTPEVSQMEVTAGYLHSAFSSSIYSYEMTLGPNEPGFSLKVRPVELTYQPTMELFVDGVTLAYDTLLADNPSKFVDVAPGQTREVMLRSTSYTDGHTKEYTVKVHRTPTQFTWTLGAETDLADGGKLLPVMLNAPTGLEMKQLSFSLGFDPAVLQLATPTGEMATTVGQCVTNVEGFKYKSVGNGYFNTLSKTLDNANGILTMDYGAQSINPNKAPYLVEAGKEGVATVYFRLKGELKPGSLFVRESRDSPQTGISVTERLSDVDIYSTCADMARIEDMPTRTYHVELPVRIFTGGTVSAQPNRTVFQAGEELLLIATPEKGYTFASWENLSMGLVEDGAKLRVSVTGDLNLSGLAVRFTRELTPETVNPKELLGTDAAVDESGTQATVTSEGGTAKLSRADGTALEGLLAGDAIVLEATPAEGMRFAGWRVAAAATDPLQSGSVAGDPTLVMENPWNTTARTGVTITATFEADSGLPGPLLGSMEVIGTEGRQLSAGNGDFGFKKDVLVYDLWLLPEETGLSLALRSENDVVKLTAKGTGAEIELTPETNQTGGITWKAGTEYLLLDLEEHTNQGTVLLTLSGANGAESVYTIRLHRAEGNPETVISQKGNDVVASVNQATLYTVSFALKIPTATFSGTADADGKVDVSSQLGALPDGLFYSRAVVEETDGGQLLRVTIDTEERGVYRQPFSISLFQGALSGVSVSTKDNSISDIRFGGLVNTTRIEGAAKIQGKLMAFDPKSEVTVQVWTGPEFETKESETVAAEAATEGSGRYEASFSVAVPQDTACKLVFQKKGHVSFTVILESGTGMTISETLYLACGELNGDGRIDFQDKFRLTGAGYGGEPDLSDPYPRDLNGDGYVDARDLNLLTGQKHYGANEQSQRLDLRGGQGV